MQHAARAGELARWHSRECAGRSGARLEAAIARLNRVNADTHAAADRLLQQIDEYEGKRGHSPGQEVLLRERR